MSKSFIVDLSIDIPRLRIAAQNGDFVAAMDIYFLLGRPMGASVPDWLSQFLPQLSVFALGQKPTEFDPSSEGADESDVDWESEFADEVEIERWEPPVSPSDFHFAAKGKHASSKMKLNHALVDLTRHKAVRDASELFGATGEARFEKAQELLAGKFGQGSAGACKSSYYKAKRAYGPDVKSPFVGDYKSREVRDWLEETGMIPRIVGLLGG